MRVIQNRNVNASYAEAVALLELEGDISRSRAGPVLVMPCPVTTVTERPCERVLFDVGRDANPFFHLFECLWMLSGSADGTWLDRFVSDFSSRFAEENGHIHGAYGKRWRDWFSDPDNEVHERNTLDQLDWAINKLRENPLDRRVVISMWDPEDDCPGDCKDHPCNTHMYPRIVDGALDLTVCVRSNDIVWGAYGANAVHLSFVQEYMAGRIGVRVGRLYQVSNNWHGYLDVMDRMGAPSGDDLYSDDLVTAEPIGNNWEKWDEDLQTFMESEDFGLGVYTNSWFIHTATPMWNAHKCFKDGNKDMAIQQAQLVQSTDWRVAATRWLERRGC